MSKPLLSIWTYPRAETPRAIEILKSRTITPEVHKALGSQRMLGLLLPKEFGGSESDYVTFTIAVEELIKVDPTMVVAFPIVYGATCSRIVSVYGTALVIWREEESHRSGNDEPRCLTRVGTTFISRYLKPLSIEFGRNAYTYDKNRTRQAYPRGQLGRVQVGFCLHADSAICLRQVGRQSSQQ
jgi:hypothetical protein